MVIEVIVDNRADGLLSPNQILLETEGVVILIHVKGEVICLEARMTNCSCWHTPSYFFIETLEYFLILQRRVSHSLTILIALM
jgi:hypothetical protein